MDAETLENKLEELENLLENGKNPLICIKFSQKSKPVRFGIYGIIAIIAKKDKDGSDTREIWYIDQEKDEESTMQNENKWTYGRSGKAEYNERTQEQPKSTFNINVPLYLVKKDQNKEFLDKKDNRLVPTRPGHYKIYSGDELFLGLEAENILNNLTANWRIKISEDYPNIFNSNT